MQWKIKKLKFTSNGECLHDAYTQNCLGFYKDLYLFSKHNTKTATAKTTTRKQVTKLASYLLLLSIIVVIVVNIVILPLCVALHFQNKSCNKQTIQKINAICHPLTKALSVHKKCIVIFDMFDSRDNDILAHDTITL